MSPSAPPLGTPPVLVYVGLGANLGDAAGTVRRAAAELAGAPGVSGLRLSPLYGTAPVNSSGPDYVNAVASLRTALPPLDLLAALQAIEQRHGRERPYRNAPRTLDLDLLLYGDQAIDLPALTVPHPRMHERAFVLRPLIDLAPGLTLAQGGLAELLARRADQAIQRLD
ncbi:2-amino-4-hydroxy-6-hydroxymethyldihydropteridine diphosphokinase [Castellaniella sp. WN]